MEGEQMRGKKSQAIPAVNSTSWELGELGTLSTLKLPFLRKKKLREV